MVSRGGRLTSTAADEFAEHGFDGASFNRIIASSGISKGAMYYYFADKEDIYGTVLDDVMDRIEALMVEVPLPTSAERYWEAAALAMRVSEELFEDARSIALMRDLYTRGPGDATWLRLLERSAGWFRTLLALGQELGAVRDDLPLDLLTEAVTGMVTAIDRWFERAMTTMEMEALLALSPKVLELLQDISRATRASSSTTTTSPTWCSAATSRSRRRPWSTRGPSSGPTSALLATPRT